MPRKALFQDFDYDIEAARLNISRSHLIARTLSEIKAEEEERLAALEITPLTPSGGSALVSSRLDS